MAVVAALSTATALAAGDIELTPRVIVTTSYDDNVFFDAEEPESDVLVEAAGRLDAVFRRERVVFDAGGEILHRYYLENDLVDRDAAASAAFTWAVSELTRLGISADYSDVSNVDRDFEETGFVFSDTRRRRVSYGISGSRQLSEIGYLRAAYVFRQDRLDGAPENDTDTHSASLNVNRSLSEKSAASLNLQVDRYTYDTERVQFLPVTVEVPAYETDPDGETFNVRRGSRILDTQTANTVNLVSLTGGVEREITPEFRVFVNAGATYVRTVRETEGSQSFTQFPEEDGPIEPTRDVEESLQATGSAGLGYKGDRTTVGFRVSHGITGAGGAAGASEQSTAGLTVTQDLMDKLSFRLAAGISLNRSETTEGSEEETEQETYRLRTALRYQFTPDWYMEGGHLYQTVEESDTGARSTRNAVSLELNYRHPLFQ